MFKVGTPADLSLEKDAHARIVVDKKLVLFRFGMTFPKAG